MTTQADELREAVASDWPSNWMVLPDVLNPDITQPERDLMAALHMQTGGGPTGARGYRNGEYDAEPEIELIATYRDMLMSRLALYLRANARSLFQHDDTPEAWVEKIIGLIEEAGRG